MRQSWHFAGYIIVLLLAASCSREVSPVAEQAADVADLILTNGKIITVDSDFAIAEALAISGDRILAVGTNAEMSALANADTVITDLEGRSVVPGLIDNHNHFVRATEQWYRQVRWDEVTTRERALQIAI